MTKRKNLSGSYTDEQVTVIGNTPTNTKSRMRNLDSVPCFEIQDMVEKRNRNIEKKRLMEIEIARQADLEHPRVAKAVPYLRVIGVIGTCIILGFTFYIISQLPAFNVPL